MNFLGLYHFERCEPEDVIYQLDYNKDGITYKDEYVQIFRDCGWDYLQDYFGYSYFRKAASEMNGDERIFCDDSSRLDMMKRVFKGRMIPLIIIFLCIIIPQTISQISLQNHDDDLLRKILTGTFITLGVIYLSMFLSFGIQFWKYRNSLNK